MTRLDSGHVRHYREHGRQFTLVEPSWQVRGLGALVTWCVWGRIVNAVATIRESVSTVEGRELLLGINADTALDRISHADPAEHGSRVVVMCSLGDLHCLHSLLATLPILFSSEEVFHNRLGAYRENFVSMAAGLRSAVMSTTLGSFGELLSFLVSIKSQGD